MWSGGAFRKAWLAEVIRLREAHAGPLHDTTEVRRAVADGGSFSQRLSRRAQYLGRRENLDALLSHWEAIARWTLGGLLIVAILAGTGTAWGALGDGSRPVNLVLALVAILGLHGLTFLLWLVGLGIKIGGSTSGLGRLWLSLTRKLARGPDAALAPRALLGVLGRSGTLPWSLGVVSHLLWLAALLSMLAALLGLLSARRYTFNWETTLLSPDTFVGLAQALGRIPASVGFKIPAESVIRLSDGLHSLPAEVQALWSSWLIGCVVVYGILPRLFAFLICLLLTRQGMARASLLDTSLPGYAGLYARLMPASERLAPDGPAGTERMQSISRGTMPIPTGAPAIVGIELAPDAIWPPKGLPSTLHNLGIVDTRAQRHAVLDQLHATPVPRLLVICDALQTPDRGTLTYITELASYADHTRVAFYAATRPVDPKGGDTRAEVWHHELSKVGICADRLQIDPASAYRWLQGEQA